ncbi:hypothetical protein [Corynebacterium lubricantis]|uniref:hypothetical protein n=1 Tax=Corynebacterium lubricantis TaxID=541095 RepID=UPI000366059C|nr:hypothetical protein [Corynebacterium lubricantis]
MEDPTRIPRVLEQLRRTWEGQPELPLATLFGVLANRGVGWGTTDEELIKMLDDEHLLHPASLPLSSTGTSEGTFLVTTVEPAMSITVAPEHVVVRAARSRKSQPALWAYEKLRPTGPGRPLVITDLEGIDHRYGVVSLITRLDVGEAPGLHGLERADISNAMWLVHFRDGTRMIIGHTLGVWESSQREVHYSSLSWSRIVSCTPGEEFAYLPASGGGHRPLGVVDSVVLIEL